MLISTFNLLFKVVDQLLHQYHRIQGHPPIELNYLLPPLRRRLNQTNTFVSIGPIEIIEIETIGSNNFAPKVTCISDLESEGFDRPFC